MSASVGTLENVRKRSKWSATVPQPSLTARLEPSRERTQILDGPVAIP
jgi:hypothetical protein